MNVNINKLFAKRKLKKINKNLQSKTLSVWIAGDYAQTIRNLFSSQLFSDQQRLFLNTIYH